MLPLTFQRIIIPCNNINYNGHTIHTSIKKAKATLFLIPKKDK